MKHLRVKFQGKEFFVLEDYATHPLGSPIFTQEQYDNFDIPFAHISHEGDIKRYRVKIGTVKDLEFLGE